MRTLGNPKIEMEKNRLCALSIGEVRWKGQGEVHFVVYTMNYSGGDRAERDVAIVLHKSVVGNVTKTCAIIELLVRR